MYSEALETLRNLVSRFAPAVKPHGAFYVMSPKRVQASIALWRRELPTVSPYYAVKCNPEPLLLNTLYDAGIHFDCASERELLEIKRLARGNAAVKRIIYANPCKSFRDLSAAKDMGSPTTVVDSVEELEKLEGYEGGALVRIAVDDSASAMPFSTKFGCLLEDVSRIADAAKALNIPLRGVSFHVGSGSAGDGSAYYKAIEAAYRHGLLKIRSAGHTSADTIDIGGGFLSE
jgi:ornithine decarboxylase